MNKTQLIEVVAKKTGTTQVKAGEAVAAVIEAVTEALEKEGSLQIVGFGSLTVETRAERKGRNPHSGEEITIPSKKVVKFSASKNLDTLVNK
jgi:DNA-binding protein HU-beta